MEPRTDSPALRAERPPHPHIQEEALLGLSRPVYKSYWTEHSGSPKYSPSHNFLPKGIYFLMHSERGTGTWSQPNTHGHCHVACAGRKGADQRYRVCHPLRGTPEYQNFGLSLAKTSGSEEDKRTRLPQAGRHRRSQAMKWKQLPCG